MLTYVLTHSMPSKVRQETYIITTPSHILAALPLPLSVSYWPRLLDRHFADLCLHGFNNQGPKRELELSSGLQQHMPK